MIDKNQIYHIEILMNQTIKILTIRIHQTTILEVYLEICQRLSLNQSGKFFKKKLVGIL
jgi:hypothetical protein